MHVSKSAAGIASDIAIPGCYSIMADESTDVSNIEQLVLHTLGGQGDESMRGIYRSDVCRSDKCRYHLHQNSRCSCAVL